MKLIFATSLIVFGATLFKLHKHAGCQPFVNKITGVFCYHAITVLLHPWPLPAAKLVNIDIEFIRKFLAPCRQFPAQNHFQVLLKRVSWSDLLVSGGFVHKCHDAGIGKRADQGFRLHGDMFLILCQFVGVTGL